MVVRRRSVSENATKKAALGESRLRENRVMTGSQARLDLALWQFLFQFLDACGSDFALPEIEAL